VVAIRKQPTPREGIAMIAQEYDDPIVCSESEEEEIGAGRSVLIVDDDQDLAESVALGLNRQGFITTLADRADLGLALARSDRPDVILLDYGLPDMDGFAVCQQLEENRTTASIPVIMLSGSVEDEMIRRARAAGCHFYLQKPYDPNALLTLIDLVLSDAA
jgi:DNA-binding response OmpR family regulator